MPSQVDRINAAMDAAIAAQEAGDFRTALAKVRTAWMIICALPNSMFDQEQLQWDREGLKNLMEELQRRVSSMPSASAGQTGIMRPVPVRYEREERYRDR